MLALEVLGARLGALLADLDRAESEHAAAIGAVAPVHRDGAVNLLAVSHRAAATRHSRAAERPARHRRYVPGHDRGRRPCQGAGGPQRSRRPGRRAGTGIFSEAINAALDRGDTILESNVEATLGGLRPEAATRIMVTLPSEAATDSGLAAECVAAGMDIARVNCAHDDPAAWAAMAANVRDAAKAAGRTVLVSMDVPGPKLRTGPIKPGPAVGRARLTRDDAGATLAPARIWLTDAAAPTDPLHPAPPAKRPTLQLPIEGAWLAGLGAGDVVQLVDARGRHRQFTVESVEAGGALAMSGRSAFIADGCELRSGVPRRLCRGSRRCRNGCRSVTATPSC